MSKDQQNLILKIAKLKVKNNNRLNKLKRQFCNKLKQKIPTNAELLATYRQMLKKKKITKNFEIEKLLQKRKIRTLSGVAPVAVLTKPYPCPGECAFCPTEKEMPKSYLSNEPAVMRAILNKFDPYKQVKMRIRALENNGHLTDKIELIIMGGTFSYFPKKYQTWFIKRCFDACNFSTSLNLKIAQKKNETTKHRIIGLTLETRPDYIDEKELKNFRELGCTKVEIGIQAIDDHILKLNKRGHLVKEIIQATKLLKQAGFKIAYHLMPNLPGATAKKDLQMFKDLFTKPEFQPDFIKIYPCVVTEGSQLYKWYKQKKFKPYSQETLNNLLIQMKKLVPQYVRIIRLIRDIPEESIVAGNKISNLRAILQQQGATCKCIRCREVRDNLSEKDKPVLKIKKYKASNATEYFLQFCSKNNKKLFAFLRLRLPNKTEQNFISEIQDCAMIREIHTYGQQVGIDKTSKKSPQHSGFGKKLIQEAEKLSKEQGFNKIAVISGIGVRNYYRKLKYRKKGTYLVKILEKR